MVNRLALVARLYSGPSAAPSCAQPEDAAALACGEFCVVAWRRLGTAVCGLLAAWLWCGKAAASLLITIDKSVQQMTVSVDGSVEHVWPVSTGRRGYGTPNGHFRPQWLARRYFSRKYYNSPMPYAIFFHEGYAIHGTEYIRRLGGPASHGCVRLHPKNAARLFELVKEHGRAHTRIVVTGTNPVEVVKSRKPRSTRAERLRKRAEARRRHRSHQERANLRRSRYEYVPAPRYRRDAAYARWYYGYYSRY